MMFIAMLGGEWYMSADLTYEIKKHGAGKWEAYNTRVMVPVYRPGRVVGETKKYLGRSVTLRGAKELCDTDANRGKEEIETNERVD